MLSTSPALGRSWLFPFSQWQQCCLKFTVVAILLAVALGISFRGCVNSLTSDVQHSTEQFCHLNLLTEKQFPALRHLMWFVGQLILWRWWSLASTYRWQFQSKSAWTLVLLPNGRLPRRSGCISADSLHLQSDSLCEMMEAEGSTHDGY